MPWRRTSRARLARMVLTSPQGAARSKPDRWVPGAFTFLDMRSFVVIEATLS